MAELTGGNRGVYWEAGYAAGLQKPVFYLCKEKEPTHFDVRQGPQHGQWGNTRAREPSRT